MKITIGKVFVFFGFLITTIACATMDSGKALFTISNELTRKKRSLKENSLVLSEPEIYQMHIRTNISNRYAHTTVKSKVRNLAATSQEAVFHLILPNTAFISGFIMEVDGKNYTAYVKEKEEAKREYEKAVSSGQAAAHVAVTARESNSFVVNVNVEPEKKAAFYLTYEELLQRRDGHYEQIINISPGQPVGDLKIDVEISENRHIVDLKVLPLRSGNEIEKYKEELDPRAKISLKESEAVISFHPTVQRQMQLSQAIGKKDAKGLVGQFVVEYDVERDPYGGEVLVQDGYFVHFFAPSELKPLPKQVVFILDTSGSMSGSKLDQLKEAMSQILDDLYENDSFHLVEFNSEVKVWNVDRNSVSNYSDESMSKDCGSSIKVMLDLLFTIYLLPIIINRMKATGSTNMYAALKVGLRLVQDEKKGEDMKRQPIIMFLTDGDPTDLSTEEISTKITELNVKPKNPIFALAFGDGADREFLQKLSLQNLGFSRYIYEASDASLQLQDFYKQISSPLLSNVTFKYESSVTDLTSTEFPIHFGGSEIVVAGWCGTKTPNSIITGNGKYGNRSFEPIITRSVSNIERLWAYLTISQLLEKKKTAKDNIEELNKRALDLALKYKFVTPVSSLVVVKPNDARAVDIKMERHRNEYSYGGSNAFKINCEIGTLIFFYFAIILCV
ncbi:hypothetical protein FQR65_LT16118 [Abscondita terminalis]|nr:hypothetical protein FQR65_LT16118 [Abscondita terminalis]